MKAFYSAKEISKAIGVTDRSVRRMAERKRWEFVLRPCPSGGPKVKFFRRKNIPERILLACEALDSLKRKGGTFRLPIRVRRQLKKKLGTMIDVAWKSCQFEDWQTLTDDEQAYLTHHIDSIIKRLNK